MQRAYVVVCILALCVLSCPAPAGPPYVTDDPQPTDDAHYEIYLFGNGATARDGNGGAAGIDFNYGAGPNLQLTAVVPLGYDHPVTGRAATGLGNVELAAKYRFAHQEDIGWDMAIFPRVFLPAGSAAVGERHASLLLPLWASRSWSRWSTFGGGGCELNRGEGSRDFCLMAWALTRKIARLQLGAELYHQMADTQGGHAATGVGAGFTHDLSDRCHLMGSVGPGLQNAAQTARYSWYAAVLFTL